MTTNNPKIPGVDINPIKLDLPDLGVHGKISKKEINEFLKLIQQRSDKNPLYQLTDKIQAASGIQAAVQLQSLYNLMRDSGIEIYSLDDVQKLISSISKSSDMINKIFKQLGIASDTREEDVDADPLARMLTEINFDDYCPPQMQDTFLKAKRDIVKTETGVEESDSEDDEARLKEMVNEIRQPIKAWNVSPDAESSVGDADEIIDFEDQEVRKI
jgi:hypothetical protein